MTGSLTIAGLGPGDAALVTPEVSAALAAATDVLGYTPYVARVPARDGLTLHPSDNRMELQRAGDALRLAAEGRSVVMVSSGDPGVFAMAAAVFEALEASPQWQNLSIRVLPGVTAMLAAAARAGAAAINAALASAAPTKPTGQPMIAAGRGQLSSSSMCEPARRFCPGAGNIEGRGLRRAHDHLRSCRDDAKGADRYSAAAGGDGGHGRHGDIGHYRQFSDTPCRPLGLRSEARLMTEPRQHVLDALHPPPLRQPGPGDHDDRQAKLARGVDLGARAVAAGISRDDPCDVSRSHQIEIACDGERAARNDDVGDRQRERAIRRIDKSQRIGVLRLGGERRQMLPADREKYACALFGKGVDRGLDIFHLDPAVTRASRPWRALQRDQRDFQQSAGFDRMAAHLGGERMGRIDHMSRPRRRSRRSGSAAIARRGSASARHRNRRRRCRREESRRRAGWHRWFRPE